MIHFLLPQAVPLCIMHRSQGSKEEITSARQLSSLHAQIRVHGRAEKVTNSAEGHLF